MSPNSFVRMPMNQLDSSGAELKTEWLWTGFLARRNLTLLTSLWKAGKTTLVSGLLQRMSAGGEFLGETCQPGKALVISEESKSMWADRTKVQPIGAHVSLMARPFRTRPTPAEWRALVDQELPRVEAGELDLIIVDTLAKFLPGRSESDPSTLLEMLMPLQYLAEAGAAVLILHHPRKRPSEEGCAARGSGALLGFVDIILELHRYGRCQTNRRRLIALSRHDQTPERLAYEWNRESGEFARLHDTDLLSYQENWSRLQTILARCKDGLPVREILKHWPTDREPPGESTLQAWLNQAFDEKLIRRDGAGVRNDPFRYRLPNSDDAYWDRGELPPLRDLIRRR